MTDKDGRKIEYMRVSVTNACNLSCQYCAPYSALQEQKLLTPMQIADICTQAAGCGVRYLRFTGGEPLMRHDFAQIVSLASNIPNVEHIAITTNGILLKDEILNLPIGSANISINATEEMLYKKLCGRDCIQQVLKNAEKAAGKMPVKINCVLLQASFEQQAEQVIAFGEQIGASVRFIELMPMGNGACLHGVQTQDIMSYLCTKYGKATPAKGRGNGPAQYFSFANLTQAVGFISPMSACFCKQCNRIRLLANGHLQPCLAKNETIDLLPALQNGGLHDCLARAISQKQGRHDLGHITLTALKEIGG